MKAVRIYEHGGPEKLILEDIPVPEPAPNEVLVKVFATAVNPVDWKIREGERKEKFPSALPLTLGWDLSGVVEKCGSDAKKFKAGDEVYGRPFPTKNGAYAEYIVVTENEINYKPKTIDHVNAAAVPLTGLTAWQGLFDKGRLQPGQKVLIHAASGGVGIFAVQLAKWKGAYVIGTASKDNLGFVKELGADEVIDYKNEKFDEKLKDIDLVYDTVGGDTQLRSFAVLKNGGRLITTVKIENEAAAKDKNIVAESYTAQSYPDQLAAIAELIDSKIVTITIAKIFSLANAADAQNLSQHGHPRGKVIIKVV
jgi:NADPH:quinone reductase-like Zn-dependent oxidoreductase